MRIDAFRPANDFKNHMDNWIKRFKASIPVDENQLVLIPGEIEYKMKAERLVTGIPLNENVVNDLMELGKTIEVQL
jgi:LDH2 family malate/lactate/ureidoglycolate dehydrogenase